MQRISTIKKPMQAMGKMGKKISPKKMDKESKPIQSGRAAKGGKSKKSMLSRVHTPKIKYKGKTYDQM